METLKAIFSRRSIRKYSGQAIPYDYIEMILKAAMQAPSARNRQPWQFIVVTDRAILEKLSSAHPYGKMLKEASAAIVVCGDKELEQMESYLLQNCSAATQNLLLAAHDLGLGAVWLGVHPREKRIEALKQILVIPDHIIPVSMISLGYPDEEKTETDRFMADRVHLDKW